MGTGYIYIVVSSDIELELESSLLELLEHVGQHDS